MHYPWKGFRNLHSAFTYMLISINLSLTGGGTGYYCYDTGYFNPHDPYDHNRNLLLSSLASNVITTNGVFYQNSIGQDPYKVYAVALCRGDSPSEESCVSCVQATSREIMAKCPYQKEAFMWEARDAPCLVHYADHLIFGVLDLPPRLIDCGGNLTEHIKLNLTEFEQIWETLMDGLVKIVTAAPYSLIKFATEEANLNAFRKIYALMQCTPDLSWSDCDLCLRQSVADSQACCLSSLGGNVQRASCCFQWSLKPFYSPDHIDHPRGSISPTSISNNIDYKDKGKYNITFQKISIVLVAAAAIMIPIMFIGVLIFRVKKSRQETKCEKEIEDTESLKFGIGTIKYATNNFSDANKLGQGGFGVVYKGMLLNGKQIAVKRLSVNSKQGQEEFKNEVKLLSRLQHRNLVRLLGFCLEQKERILVYELLPNSSLDHFIFNPTKRECLDWGRRFKIIGGIARGLLYLHEDSRLQIIHCDIKASNILLDSEMNPKISDFGTGRLFEMSEANFSEDKVVGTFGYMAPEYIIHQRFSDRTDVFSFGVLLLEIVSGQKRSCFGTIEETKCLLTYAWKRWNEGTALNLIDSSLREGSTKEMMKCIHIGLLCVQESASDRPSMASVVHMLNCNIDTLPTPSKPGFFMPTPNVFEVSPS